MQNKDYEELMVALTENTAKVWYDIGKIKGQQCVSAIVVGGLLTATIHLYSKVNKLCKEKEES